MPTSPDPIAGQVGTRLGHRFRAFRERLRHNPSLRRTLALTVVLLMALAAVVWLVLVDLRYHADAARHAAAKAALLLLPFLVAAIAARLPALKRRIGPRFIIRPFGTTSSRSEYDGSAIAVLLYREIVAWPVKASGGLASEVGRVPLPPVNVTVGGTSVPLHWVWSRLRQLLTGKEEVAIDGLLIDSEMPYRLQVSSGRKQWNQVLDASQPEALQRAISNLTPRVLELIDPVLAARVHWDRWNHDEAIRLISAEDHTREIQLEHVAILLDGDYQPPAERLLNQLQPQIPTSSVSAIEFYRLRADARTRRGDYEAARALLETALSHPQCMKSRPDAIPELRRQLADLCLYEKCDSDAIDAYLESGESAIDELRRLTGEEDVDVLAALQDHPLPANTSGEIVAALWTLYWIDSHRAHCRWLLDDPAGALEDLENARGVVIKLWPHETHPLARAPLEYAIATKSIARIQLQIGDEEFRVSAREAISWFDKAIEQREQWLKEAADDLQAVADLAWCHLGKGACLHLLDSRSDGERVSGAYQKENDEEERDQLHHLLQRSLRGLNREGREQFRSRLELAQLAQDLETAYRRRLSLAASSLTERLVLDLAPDDFLAVVEEIERLDVDSPAGDRGLEDGVAPWLGDFARQKLSQAGFNEDDVVQLHLAILDMLDRFLAQDAEGVRSFLASVEWLTEIADSFGSCEQTFVELAANPLKRVQAEGLYGLACVNAARGRFDEAERKLAEAVNTVGDNNLHYVHRAMLDDDLIEIHERLAELAASVRGSDLGRPEDVDQENDAHEIRDDNLVPAQP